MAHRVAFAGYELAVEERGSTGAPVVLVHSTGMSSQQWKRLAARLSVSHRVLLPDLIGYGESSPWPRGEVFHWHLDVLGLEALLDSLSEPAHLVGHSYGGLVALAAALHRPKAVRSLDAEPITAPTLPDEPGAGERWLTWFVDYWNFPGAWAQLPERARASFLATVDVCYGEVRSLLSDRTPPAVWATIAAPTLLVRGELSPVGARHVAEALSQCIRGAALRDVAGAGHMAPLTHESVVSAMIAQHIAAH
jgi:pimeloyl-ACP methyl ester carboxylesterase